MKSLEKLIDGTEVGLEELGKRANLAQIQKVSLEHFISGFKLTMHLFLLSCELIMPFIFQHFKISAPELAVSSLADAIVCRIAARDAL